MPSQKFVRGLKIRREVLGDEYVDKAMKNPWKYAADFHELVTEVVWGSVWDRPGLTRRERSLITLGIIAALNQPELELHTRGALRNGCKLREIKEVFMHVGVYCGVPVHALSGDRPGGAFAIRRGRDHRCQRATNPFSER
jgi:4-carboxymuconolactone decarboxylase